MDKKIYRVIIQEPENGRWNDRFIVWADINKMHNLSNKYLFIVGKIGPIMIGSKIIHNDDKFIVEFAEPMNNGTKDVRIIANKIKEK